MADSTNHKLTSVLVTGANGQLGSELRMLASACDSINFIFTDIEDVDITDADRVERYLQDIKPDFIVNCAAYTAVDRAEDDSENSFLLNAEAPKNLATSSKRIGAKLIHISTDYVFNGKSWEPYNENHPTSPNSVYGWSKLKGEEAVLSHGNGMVIRTSWLYSAHGNNFVKTIARKGQELNNLKVVFDQIGSPTWANDLAKAIIEIIKKSEHQFVSEVFHYSNEGVSSWYDFAKEIISFLKINCSVSPVLSAEYKVAANRPPFSVLNKEKIKRTFEIQIPYWKESLHSCLKSMAIEVNNLK